MGPRTPLQRLLLAAPNLQPQHPLVSPLQRRRLLQCRNFGHSAPVQKGGNAFLPEQPQQRQPPQKSFNVMVEEQRRTAQQPNDIGLAPLTFIMPTGSNLPSGLSARWRFEKARARQRLTDLFARVVMKVWYIRPRPNLQTSAIPTIAQDLYAQMYTCFARGDLGPVAPKLCESIADKLESRIVARAPNSSLRWTLHRYLARPRVVSHRLMPMSLETDKAKQTALQQAVVRIRSLQSLERVRKVRAGAKVSEVADEGSVVQPRDVVEYLVVQRRLNKGVWGPWMIWGTTQETTDLDNRR